MAANTNDRSTWLRRSAVTRILLLDDVLAVILATRPDAALGRGEAWAKWSEIAERVCQLLHGEDYKDAFREACRSDLNFEAALEVIKAEKDTEV